MRVSSRSASPSSSAKIKPPPLIKRGALAWHQASENALKYNNRLVVHAVDDNTNRVYQKAVKEFLVDVKRHEIDFTSFEARDHALAY